MALESVLPKHSFRHAVASSSRAPHRQLVPLSTLVNARQTPLNASRGRRSPVRVADSPSFKFRPPVLDLQSLSSRPSFRLCVPNSRVEIVVVVVVVTVLTMVLECSAVFRTFCCRLREGGSLLFALNAGRRASPELQAPNLAVQRKRRGVALKHVGLFVHFLLTLPRN